MTTLTFRKITFYFFLVAFTLIAMYKGYVNGATTQSTPYRTTPYSSGASVQLRGVSNGDTLTGAYNSDYGLFEFDVVNSAFYTKWYDLLGGTSYTRDETWSALTGKWITGGDMGNSLKGYNTQRFYSNFTDINSFVRSAGDTSILVFDKTTPDTLTDTNIVYSSNKIINFGKQKIIQDRNETASDDFDAFLNLVLQDSFITFQNGKFDGWADSSVQVSIQNVTTSQMDISLSGIVTDSLKYWYIYVTAGASADSSVRISGNAASVGSWTTVQFNNTWTYPPDHTSTVKITPRNEFQHGFNLYQSNNIRFENVDIMNFGGDGISMYDCEDVTITNCNIDNPLIWFTLYPYQLLLGRQGISVIAQPTTTTYSGDWTEHGKTKPNPTGLCKNIKITNNKIRGGSPGAIDFEPNGVAIIEDVDVSHNYLWGSSRGIAIENATAAFRDFNISNNIFYNNTWGGSLKGNSCSNINYLDNQFIDHTARVLWLANGIETFTFSGNRIVQNSTLVTSSTTNALEFPVGGEHITITDNDFIRWGKRNIYAISGETIIIRGNYFEDIGSGSSIDQEGMYIAGFDKVIIEDNVFKNRSGTYFSRPGTIYNCDTVIVRNNICTGATSSNRFAITGTYDVLIDEGNNFPHINNAYTEDLVNLLLGNSLVDSILVAVDSLAFYIAEFDTTQNRTYTIKWSDSTHYTHGPDSTWTQQIFQPRNDSLWIVGSPTFTDDSVSVYDYLYGTDMMVGIVGTGGQNVVGKRLYPASRNRILFPGYRDVIPNAIGASIEAWNLATYLTSNPYVSQGTVLNFYTNWYDSGTMNGPKQTVKSLSLEGEHVVPTGLQLPSDSTSVPRFGDMYINPTDSLLYFYNGLTFVKLDTLN